MGKVISPVGIENAPTSLRASRSRYQKLSDLGLDQHVVLAVEGPGCGHVADNISRARAFDTQVQA